MRIVPTQHIEKTVHLTVDEAVERGFLCKMGDTVTGARLVQPVSLMPGQTVHLNFLTSSGLRSIAHCVGIEESWSVFAGAENYLQTDGILIGSKTTLLNAFWAVGKLTLDYGYLVFPDGILRHANARELLRYEYRRRLRLNRSFQDGIEAAVSRNFEEMERKFGTIQMYLGPRDGGSFVTFSLCSNWQNRIASFDVEDSVELGQVAKVFADEMYSKFGETVSWSDNDYRESGYYNLAINMERKRSIREWTECFEGLCETMAFFNFPSVPVSDKVSYLKAAGVRFSSIYADSDNQIQDVAKQIKGFDTTLTVDLPSDPELHRLTLDVISDLFSKELAAGINMLSGQVAENVSVSDVTQGFSIRMGMTVDGLKVVTIGRE